MDEAPSQLGVRRFLAWMNACEAIGWSKADMPRLADLFWRFKDRDGNLRGEPSAGGSQS
jgi:hypothetical protein